MKGKTATGQQAAPDRDRRSLLDRVVIMKNDKQLKNAPLTDYEKARIQWFENYGSAVVEKNRYFALTVLLTLVVIALGMALMTMAPLKSVVPYVIRVSNDGHVTADPAGAMPYQPGDKEKKYFLGRWTKNLLTLDPVLTERLLTEAYEVTRGKASDEFTDFLKRTQPIEKVKSDPLLTRTASISSISFVEGNVALIRVETETRRMSTEKIVDKYLVTIHYDIIPAKTDREILNNPIGLFITHFDVSEDLAK